MSRSLKAAGPVCQCQRRSSGILCPKQKPEPQNCPEQGSSNSQERDDCVYQEIQAGTITFALADISAAIGDFPKLLVPGLVDHVAGYWEAIPRGSSQPPEPKSLWFITAAGYLFLLPEITLLPAPPRWALSTAGFPGSPRHV